MNTQGGAYVIETNTRLDAAPTWNSIVDATPRIYDDDGTTEVLADDGVSPVFWIGQDQLTTPQMLSQLNVARNSKATGLTAGASGFATALPLTADINFVTTAGAGTGVVLSGTKDQIVFNAQATNLLQVYAPGGITIDGTAGATGVGLAASGRCIYYLSSATTYVSAKLGVISS
jgi:hypothetical protein